MKSNFDLYKNSWRIYRKHFATLTTFAVSICILLICSFVAYLFLSGYDFGLTGILIFAFGVVPLFFSFQMVIAKVSAGNDISYNELYSTYKLYFNRQNRGVYSVIFSLFFTLIIATISIWLSVVLYDFIYPDAIENAMQSINVPPSNIEYYEHVINAVLGLDNYPYFLICFLPFPFLFFFRRIRKRLMLPYFNLSVSIPMVFAQQLNKKICEKNKAFIKTNSLWSNVFFDIAFYLGFVLAGVLALLFGDNIQYIEHIFVISLAGGLILSVVFITPLLIVQCFLADNLHVSYLSAVKDQMVKMTKNATENENIDEDQKDMLKKALDTFEKEIEQNDKQSDETQSPDQSDEQNQDKKDQ